MTTFTYTGNPATDNKDAVRFQIADTNRDGLGWLLSDEEILYTLTQDGSPLWAAVRCAETIAAGHAGARDVVSKRVGDLAIQYGHQGAVKDWSDIARMLRRRASRGAAPYAGGVEYTDKVDDMLDSSLLHGSFRRGQFDPLNMPREEGGPVASTYTWST